MSDAALHTMANPPMNAGAKRLFHTLIAARGAPVELAVPEEHEMQDIGLARGAVPGEAWGSRVLPR